ncbi:superoxide dismutase family protein [candidate division GN15 bacterium]|nr:superoxide dismutase family protein [candidate division GN15 bacterium]
MKRLTALLSGLLPLGLIIGLNGCGGQEHPPGGQLEEVLPGPTKAVAVLHPTEGNDAYGTVTFTETPDGVEVVADVYNLEPGLHGFHIHEYGDCSEPDATSAGGHFAPMNREHGAPDDLDRHVGDLGNIMADSTGHGHYEETDTHLTMSGVNSIIGRGVIVHEGEDDLTTQPTGAAGARVACGVVGIDED